MEKRLIDAISAPVKDDVPKHLLSYIAFALIAAILLWMVAHQKASHAPHSHPETAHSHDDSALKQLDNRISNLAGQVMAHSNELESLSGQSAQPTKYRVTEQYTNVRTSPSTDADIIESLFVGEQVTVTGEVGEWYSVLYGDQPGFIHQSLLERL